jgi:succinylglutamate desuccinylase
VLIARDPSLEGVMRVTGDTAGPRVVMFCGIHGDEVSGIHAIEKLFYDLFGGARRLAQGSLVLARANAQAIRAERRYVKHNMNRMFCDSYSPEIDQDSYEFRRTQELKPLLETCDYFLDFHSAPLADQPFIVVEQRAVDFYRRLGIPKIMTGWSKFSSGPIGGDTENYANTRGAISATLESGSHFDKASNDIAYRAAVSTLSILSMLDTNELPPSDEDAEVVEMYSVITKDAEDFRYAEGATNFKQLRAGEAFAYQNGQPLTVSEESYLLIPMNPGNTKLHEEIGYLGRRLKT